MRKLLLLAAAVVVAAAGCGSSAAPEQAAIRGQAGTTTSTEATTTTTTASTTTLPVEVSDIPSIADLGLTWDEPATVNPLTGRIDMADFNSYLIDNAPTGMLPDGSLDTKSTDAAEEEVAGAELDALKKAVVLFLGIDPADPNVQMLVGQGNGPDAKEIIVVQLVPDGPGVRAIRYEFLVQYQDRAGFQIADVETEQAEEGLEGDAEEQQTDEESQVTPEGVEEETEETGPKDLIPIVLGGYTSTQCEPGAGHQDFTTGDC